MLIEDLRRTLDNTGADLSLLDIGAGLGAIHHDLLDGTIAHATHVDASPAQLAAARSETTRRGHADQVEFHEGDFVSMANEISDADIVTLDRVICCFDKMEQLVTAAATKTRLVFGAVYPRDELWMRFSFGAINLWQRLRRSSFRVFLHDPRSIDARLRAEGLMPWSARHTVGWHVVVYRRHGNAASADKREHGFDNSDKSQRSGLN